jgi:hypothetical protein
MILNPIRLNWHYVIWYRNFASLMVSLVVPFTLLAYWNFNTFLVLLRRRRLRNRPSQYQASSENPTGILPELAAATLNASTVLPHIRTHSTYAQGTSFYPISILVITCETYSSMQTFLNQFSLFIIKCYSL